MNEQTYICHNMSRITIGSFVSKAKDALSKSIRSKGEHPASFVIGNQSADLDSITCALVYGCLKSNTSQARNGDKYIIPVTNIPSSELRLRPELTALLKHADLKPSDLVTLDDVGNLHESLPPEKTDWVLVDHNALLGELGEHYSERVVGVIDHHDDEGKVPQNAEPRIIEKTGSCNSHVVNYCRDAWGSISSSEDETAKIDAQLAKLALGAILIDTVNLEAEAKVTEHDRKAVDYLKSKINLGSRNFDPDAFFTEINNAKSNLDSLTLEEILRKDYKQWDESSLKLGISSCVRSISYLQEKTPSSSSFLSSIQKYAQSEGVDLYAIMTAHNEGDSFTRQLLLLAVSEGKAVDIAQKFADENAGELELEESKTKLDGSSSSSAEAKWLRVWEQGNLAASRKKVAPLLREAMG